MVVRNLRKLGTIAWFATLGVAAGVGAAACSTADPAPKPSVDPQDSTDYLPLDPIPDPLQQEQQQPPIQLNPQERTDTQDAGAIGDGGRAEGGADAAADAGRDAGRCATDTSQPAAPKPGDLQIVELMLSSKAGASDEGEWVEVLNASPCPLNINGVSVESPRGTSMDTATVANAPALAPGAAFVVAASLVASKNNNLPNVAAAWNTADVLKNDGDTVVVRLGALEIDKFTYPKVSPAPLARTLTFPSICAPARRATIQAWSLSFRSWTPGFLGTPGKPNDDVLCPP